MDSENKGRFCYHHARFVEKQSLPNSHFLLLNLQIGGKSFFEDFLTQN